MSVTSKLHLIRQVLSTMFKGPGFDTVLSKMNVIEAGGGRCICELKVDEEHQNRKGTLHGGMTATIVDTVTTAALMSNDNTGPGVSVDMSISYMRAAKVGDEILIDARTEKLGKSLAFLSVDIRNKEDNKLIATGTHTKHLGNSSGSSKL